MANQGQTGAGESLDSTEGGIVAPSSARAIANYGLDHAVAQSIAGPRAPIGIDLALALEAGLTSEESLIAADAESLSIAAANFSTASGEATPETDLLAIAAQPESVVRYRHADRVAADAAVTDREDEDDRTARGPDGITDAESENRTALLSRRDISFSAAQAPVDSGAQVMAASHEIVRAGRTHSSGSASKAGGIVTIAEEWCEVGGGDGFRQVDPPANQIATITGDAFRQVTEDSQSIVTGTLTVSDADAGEAHTEAVSNAAATYGTWSVDSDGNWSYDLDENNAVVQSLGVGHSISDNFTISSLDGSAQYTVTVNIGGVNDAPADLEDSDAAANQISTAATTGTAVGVTLSARDIDGDVLSYVLTDDAGGRFQVEASTGEVTVAPGANLTPGSYVITGVAWDGHTVSTQQSYTITVVNQSASITGDAFGQVIEDSQSIVSGTLTVSDADAGEAHTEAVGNAAATYGTWSVDSDGNWSYDLDDNNLVVQSLGVGHSISDNFTVSSLDGSAQYTVTVNIGGYNDAPADLIDSDAAINRISTAAATGTAVGVTLSAGDIDGDVLSYALTDDAGGRFKIDASTGKVTVAPGADLTPGTYVITGVAWDGASHSAPTSHTITIQEANAAPELASTVIATAFTAATVDGWGVWIVREGAAPERIATFDTFPRQVMQLGGKLYFTGNETQHGNELWCYDIATGVTGLAADVWAGSSDSNPGYLTALSGKLYFAASSKAEGTELWVYDPATQTASLAADILPGAGGASPQYLTAVGGKLYFTAYQAGKGGELWVFDPATQLAKLVADIWPGANGSYPQFLTEIGEKLYFTAIDNVRGRELWIFNPATSAASVVDLLPGTSGSNPNDLLVLDGKLYFSATSATYGREIFAYDPATQSTQLVADLRAGPNGSYPGQFAALGGKLYFTMVGATNNYELWVYNPATQLANQIADVPTAPTAPGSLAAIGDKLYFSYDDGEHGRELWTFDPATGDAAIVYDLDPHPTVGFGSEQLVAGGKVYFHGFDHAHGSELWVYDPASNTAALAFEAWPGSDGANTNFLAALGGKIYFTASDAAQGSEIWVFDPASGSANLATEINAGQGGSMPQYLTVLDGKLYFSADDGVQGSELWVYDPAAGVSTPVLDINPGGMGSSPQNLTVMDGKLYFSADDGTHSAQLWVFDPASQSAQMLTNMGQTMPWPMGADPKWLTVLGGKLYFSADDGTNGRELWVYDPATGTPSLVGDLLANGGSNPQGLIALDGKLYFRAYDATVGAELWVHDPVTQSTSVVADICPGADSGAPYEFEVLGGKLYFSAFSTELGHELRVFDPATNTVSLIANLITGAGSSSPHDLTAIDGKLFFAANDPVNGDRPWVYDPATGTTTMVNVMGGQPSATNPQQIAPVVSDGIALAPISADPTSNVGATVAAILGLHASDADGDALGIAIIGADAAHGAWQYSLDDGASWIVLGAVSGNAATLLDETAEIRFVPDAGWSGTAEITIRAWDQSDGHASGDTGIDATSHGGESAFSAAALDASIVVTPVTIINGGGTAETLTGTIGADLIDGGLGDDILIGSAGGDTLTGGAGSDRFSYALASHSSLNYLDIITDFSLADGDEIDFSALGLAGGITDGGMVSGFGHGPASDFNGNGIIIETDGTDTRIYADADHSGTFSAHADLVVQVSGNHLGDLISQAAAQIII